MKFPRASGILLHPTSLPNNYGVGDFGKSAYNFVDFLSQSDQTYWQILPLGPTGYADSPYQSFSAFAGNTNLISPEFMVDDGLITADDIHNRPDFPTGVVDYGTVIDWKNDLLTGAYERFRVSANVDMHRSFETFTEGVADWLDDYALFRAIKITQNHKSWFEWAIPLRKREESALLRAREELMEEIRAQKFYQFLFFKQWTRLKNYANGKGVKIIGDIPIFVSLDSADAWCSPGEFKLNKDLTPKVVAGVPPDYFSKTGQLWGNPIYNWEKMKADGFAWWIRRIRFSLKTIDILRIDHFRGFAASWEVPGNDKTAENGQWVNVPGGFLFQALRNAFGELPIIAEDLGACTPDVERLRDDFGFPGMHILQYAFGGDSRNQDLPHNYRRRTVAYSGTHDNDTTVGWFKTQNGKSSNRDKSQIACEREYCLKYLGSEGKEIHWDFIRALWSSVADTVIVPMQDLLGLDNSARMNLPGTKTGNWQWRCNSNVFSGPAAARLKDLTEVYGRSRPKV